MKLDGVANVVLLLERIRRNKEDFVVHFDSGCFEPFVLLRVGDQLIYLNFHHTILLPKN